MTVEETIVIERVNESRIAQFDFDNLPFGRVFSDHMFTMDYADGAWGTPKVVPFQPLTISPAMSALHYGQAIFEGMKAFGNERGETFLFRPKDNIARLNTSARRMCMPQVDEAMLLDGLKTLVHLDRAWVPTKPHSSLYIRPFMFATDEYIGVKPSETYKLIVFTCPVNAYYKGNVKVKVERHYTRSAPGGTGFAKAAGNYAGALYPAKLAQEQGFDQLIWTDAVEHKYIEESGTMNVVFRSGNKVFSPPPSETILDGITRDSIMRLAETWGYEVEYRRIAVEQIRSLLEAGKLDEAFGAGTAATVAPIAAINIDEEHFTLPDPSTWELAGRLGRDMDAIKRGNLPDTMDWCVAVV